MIVNGAIETRFKITRALYASYFNYGKYLLAYVESMSKTIGEEYHSSLDDIYSDLIS